MSPSSANQPASTPRLDSISLLGAYASRHEAASSELRGFLFELSRARRSTGGFHLGSGGGTGGISALDVREELRAKAVLETNLVGDIFTLFPDGRPVKNEAGGDREGGETEVGKPTDSNAVESEKNKRDSAVVASVGLRRRRNAGGGGTDEAAAPPKSSWTEEAPILSPTEDDDEEEEEKRLRRADPIDLFGGLPPPALRSAQRKARKALMLYVEAACLAAEIMKLTQAEGGDSEDS
mmetsp:Transcript_14152/g.29107  ORF Transcript_14152/g.29107 Transcript_14152/m.29107 type:complete len:237 (-) Transcript_14152:107-817(-)|eukprot:CAMPEP_0183296734 /NCGR_PEP_ID=MMETSP0160_2-20130417/4175_1 /TAXON_ID=2839 ORGANISM="Odontella Sinensis, Strain Grunow 1884" /NCGR_SAMPLE_ID=MMETSP0160_2 /ASSEMBLY_ACC=CAM_ASM_000250 /LENGTH=236 /DNA_ID=CAMNT_0025458395 /DNA_START=48 /DNA_END=758 /DNA_ORIENTATION=-